MKKMIAYSCLVCFAFILMVIWCRENKLLSEKGNNSTHSTLIVTTSDMKYITSRETFVITGSLNPSNDFSSIADRFREAKSNGVILPVLSRFVFQFTEVLPKKIKWYEYCMDENGDFLYASKKDVQTEEGAVENIVTEVSESTFIDFGIRKDLASSDLNVITYRCIRIVCDYQDEQVEYLLIDKKEP